MSVIDSPVSTETPSADEHLVALAQQGDEHAFSELVRRHRANVRGCALRIVSRAEDAEDVAQETWLSVYSHLPGFRGDSSFRTWLGTITRSKSLLHLRRAKTSAVDLAENGYDGSGPLADALSSRLKTPERLAAESEMRALVLAAMRELKPKYGRLLYLWAVEERKLGEIAETTGVSYNTAKVSLFRARVAARDWVRKSMIPSCAAEPSRTRAQTPSRRPASATDPD
jgi:RNA polymerase sigma-70 factor (ECF subfamily)